ncbi:MAG: leucine-rich repeat domain-containing protein [Dysgonamonadaceae bacterium]|jgi:hypothetical protein|nr:leucine-rich repeat domain-containing protein [Dysgonamonadaceae bacterium]
MFLRKIARSGGSCGRKLVWTVDKGVLTIKGEGNMRDFYIDNVPWSKYRLVIKEIEIGEGVTYIGSYAFFGCEAITEITIPAAVNGIEKWAFGYCGELAEITCLNINPPIIKPAVFDKVNVESMKLFVPYSALGAYSISPVWKDFGAIKDVRFKKTGNLRNKWTM